MYFYYISLTEVGWVRVRLGWSVQTAILNKVKRHSCDVAASHWYFCLSSLMPGFIPSLFMYYHANRIQKGKTFKKEICSFEFMIVLRYQWMHYCSSAGHYPRLFFISEMSKKSLCFGQGTANIRRTDRQSSILPRMCVFVYACVKVWWPVTSRPRGAGSGRQTLPIPAAGNRSLASRGHRKPASKQRKHKRLAHKLITHTTR